MFRFLLVVIASLMMVSCNPETLGYVKKAKYDALQKQLETAKADLNTVRHQVSECQPHEYQIYNEGFRTWQLDLATGERCVLLTTEDDLKKLETRMQVSH